MKLNPADRRLNVAFQQLQQIDRILDRPGKPPTADDVIAALPAFDWPE